jgi:hypothetical protein
MDGALAGLVVCFAGFTLEQFATTLQLRLEVALIFLAFR